MVVLGLERATLRLVPDQLLPVDADVTMYTIIHQSLVYSNKDSPENGVKMIIILQRKIMSELLTTYLPTLLLILITFAQPQHVSLLTSGTH